MRPEPLDLLAAARAIMHSVIDDRLGDLAVLEAIKWALHGRKQAWACWEMGLITDEELVNLVACILIDIAAFRGRPNGRTTCPETQTARLREALLRAP